MFGSFSLDRKVKTLGHFTFWISVFAQRNLSETAVTHRPQGVIIVGIYMSSNIYYLFIIFILKQKGVTQTYRLADV